MKESVKKSQKYKLHLKSGDRVSAVEADWLYNEVNVVGDEVEMAEMKVRPILESTQEVRLKLELDGEKIELAGEVTEMIFEKLARLLKDRYEIISCFTCRYGNFCPCGDTDNEIFCINDFEPKCKEDVYFPTEDPAEREKRRRSLFDICDEFKQCSDDYFTYR